jgi:hypothetical protein
MAVMETLLVLLRSSYDDGSWLIKIIVGIVAAIIVSAIKSGKKNAKKTTKVQKPTDLNNETPEPMIDNNDLDKILSNQEKMNQISQSKEDSIWEDDKKTK